MPDKHEMMHDADLWSVRRLLDQFKGDASWTLAVAQRAFEWDTIRVSNLVDSILRGFPIGSLLVAQQKGPHYLFDDHRRFRDLATDEGETTQLLDGQQRCRAILASFSGQGLPNPKTGRRQVLWVNLLAPNPRYQEFSRENSTLCLTRWLDDDLNPNDEEPEKGWIQFHRLIKLVGNNARPRTLAKEAYADFEADGVEAYIRQLKDVVSRALDRKHIPVHVLRGAEAADLHQVFVRLNVGGKPLSAPDEFFAGAKRYWPHAEAGIRPLIEILSPLGRRGTITLLARAAGRTMKPRGADPYPLRLELLARTATQKKNNPLVAQMQHLAETDGVDRLAEAMSWVSDLCFQNMSCGLHGLRDTSWMSAVGWAFAWARKRPLPPIDDERYVQPLCSFLFWTSLLGSQTYGRGWFARNTFERCWESGQAGQPVPYGEPEFERTCFRYDYVQNLLPKTQTLGNETPEEDRKKIYDLMRRNRWLFLGPFQGVGRGRGWNDSARRQPGMEWEHIVPFNKARALFKVSRTYISKYTDQIGATGNFAAIDGRSNRVFNDCSIGKKVGWAQDDPSQTYEDFPFVRAKVNLTDTERDLLKQIDHELEEGRDKVAAGEAFLAFVERRSRRIWRNACSIAGPPPAPERELKVTR